MNMNDENLIWLLNWYESQCDGDWEHEYGITMETIDNPGWSLIVDIIGTPLEDKPFDTIREDFTDENWYRCWVADKKFHAGGGPKNLKDLVKVFVDWAKDEPELME